VISIGKYEKDVRNTQLLLQMRNRSGHVQEGLHGARTIPMVNLNQHFPQVGRYELPYLIIHPMIVDTNEIVKDLEYCINGRGDSDEQCS